MNTKIIVACHGGIDGVFDPIMFKYQNVFVPVLGGAIYHQYPDTELMRKMQKDDDGPNISWTNPYLCEITPLYWAYKNIHRLGDPDMIGLCHYRRVLDLDYNELDKDTVYLKRCDCPIPEHHTFLGNYWADPAVAVMVRDLYFSRFPQYAELQKIVQDDYTFYDKEMFIMNLHEFFHYMEYMSACLHILMDEVYPTVLSWGKDHLSDMIDHICYHRGLSYFLEYFAAMYFAMLQERGYHIQVAPLTKGSNHDNYGHLCVPRIR